MPFIQKNDLKAYLKECSCFPELIKAKTVMAALLMENINSPVSKGERVSTMIKLLKL